MSTGEEPEYTRPLNPTLYRALHSRFGSVIVANRGSRMSGSQLPQGILNQRSTMRVVTWGEYYRINCPFCGDHRRRLWINHLYAVPNERGWPETWLAVCYNESCTKSAAHRQELERMIFGMRNRNDRMRPVYINAGEDISQALQVIGPPGDILRLDELPNEHPAIQYVYSRRYTPRYLAETYGVGYVLAASSEYPLASGRLYIPIYMDGQLVGWQTRFVGETDWKRVPKYYGRRGMPKTRMLYNIDVARHWPFVVVVEGATSTWRLGGPGLAALGKTLGGPQQILLQHWRGKPVFLILDPDAALEMEGIIADLRRDGHLLVPIYLPEGYDPDNYEHSALVNMIRFAGRQANIEIPEW